MLHRWYVPQNSTSYALVEKQWSKLYIGQIVGKMGGQKLYIAGASCWKNMGVDPIHPRRGILTGDPLHSRALAHSRAPLFTQPCPHCSHSRAPGEQWARLCVFTLQGCVQAARLCRGSPVILIKRGQNVTFVKLGSPTTTYFKFQVKMQNSYKNRGRNSTFAVS